MRCNSDFARIGLVGLARPAPRLLGAPLVALVDIIRINNERLLRTAAFTSGL